MLNNYELILIINSNLDEATTKATAEKFTNMIAAEGTVESVEEWGKKKLAYPIKKMSEGYYVLVNFKSNPGAIAELERVIRITDEVLKHIVVKKD